MQAEEEVELPVIEEEYKPMTPPTEAHVEVVIQEPTEIQDGESEKSEIEATKEVREVRFT